MDKEFILGEVELETPAEAGSSEVMDTEDYVVEDTLEEEYVVENVLDEEDSLKLLEELGIDVKEFVR